MKFFFLLFLTQISFAQVLLLPDQTVDFKQYRTSCEKEGYLCTTQFQLQYVKSLETPQFDDFVNQLDYSSDTFKNEFIVKFFKILKEESISVDQIDMMVKIIQQLKEFSDVDKKKQFTLLEQQLNGLIQLIKENQLTELPENYLIVFKTAVPSDFLKYLKPPFFKVKFYNSVFNKVLGEDASFVDGVCKSVQVHPSVINKKWQIESERACGLSEHFSRATKSTGDFVEKHQAGLITTGIVLVGAAILMNNYEIKLTF